MIKQELAMAMLERAHGLGIPFKWVTGECIYGDYRSLRLWQETLPKGYALTVSGKECVNIA